MGPIPISIRSFITCTICHVVIKSNKQSCQQKKKSRSGVVLDRDKEKESETKKKKNR